MRWKSGRADEIFLKNFLPFFYLAALATTFGTPIVNLKANIGAPRITELQD